jgi:hypothetical protein
VYARGENIILEFRRQVVQLRQQVVRVLASNIGPGDLGQLAECTDDERDWLTSI